MARVVGQEDQSNDVTQEETAIKNHKPVKKCLGNLFHDEIDHWSICHQDEGACQPLRDLDQEHHGVITRAHKLVLQCVNCELYSSIEKSNGYLLHLVLNE